MREVNYHIIHCSDSTFGDVSEIRKWHLARGFLDVGYHFVIRRDGEIEVGRTLDIVGAHCKGFNLDSIGTCLVGKNEFTKHQFKSLEKIHAMLKCLFPKIEMKGHYEFNVHKTCPNFNPQEKVLV